MEGFAAKLSAQLQARGVASRRATWSSLPLQVLVEHPGEIALVPIYGRRPEDTDVGAWYIAKINRVRVLPVEPRGTVPPALYADIRTVRFADDVDWSVPLDA